MTSRLGIELTPAACRVLELEGGRSWRPDGRDSVVRSCVVVPAEGAERRAALARLRGRQASVVVWGVPSEHRQVMVRDGSYEAMQAEARASLAAAGVDMGRAWSDITPAGLHRGHARRPVIVTLAEADAMRVTIQPLLAAGVRLRAVMTPAAALAAIARSRRGVSAPEAVEVYIALEETATCLALMQGGSLTAARDLAWGYRDPFETQGYKARERHEIVSRLGDELIRFFEALGESLPAVHTICVCGGAPDLRSITLPLMERFDVEVETLDSLYAIDAARLPASNDPFQERVAEWRIAWAAAAEWPPAINLLRPQRRHQSQAWMERAAVVAGIAAGWSGGVTVARLVPPPGPTVTRTAVKREAVMAGVLPVIRQEPPTRVRHEPPVLRQEPDLPPPAAPRAAIVLASASTGVSRATAVRRVHGKGARVGPMSADGGSAPFDAVLETILFSPDRQLAIVDGRVVARDDAVRGATVVEITSGSVLLRDGLGRLRRLAGR